MIGYHSVSVYGRCHGKRITGFDYEKAFEAAKHSVRRIRIKAYKQNGFISLMTIMKAFLKL
jgi:hypothetical protein